MLNQKKQKTAVNIPKPVFVWPRVEYGGTLNDDKGLVKLNNSLVIAEEGKVVNEFTILNIYPDSIRISYKEKTKVFFKKKWELLFNYFSFLKIVFFVIKF